VNKLHASTATNSAIDASVPPATAASWSGHEKRHDGKHRKHHIVDRISLRETQCREHSLIDRPRSQSTSPHSATSRRASAMHPIPNRAEGVDGTARRRTIHCAVTIVTTSMTGLSISSDILAPTRGTTHSVRISQGQSRPRTRARNRALQLSESA
jgi:hypothetical protein